MTNPTLTDRAAAPAARRVLAQAGFELTTILRNGEQLLITLLLPAGLLLLLRGTQVLDLDVQVATPGVLAVAVMSTAFTSQAIATGFDRRAGVLRLLATTPLGRGGLLAGKVLAVLTIELIQVVVLAGMALALGWRPAPAGVPAVLLMLAAGTAAFGSLGLLLAGVLRAEAVLAVANLVWILLLVAGGVLLPTDRMPQPWGGLARLLPSGALGDGLRAALADGGPDVGALLVLVAWSVVCGAVAVRAFRWD